MTLNRVWLWRQIPHTFTQSACSPQFLFIDAGGIRSGCRARTKGSSSTHHAHLIDQHRCMDRLHCGFLPVRNRCSRYESGANLVSHLVFGKWEVELECPTIKERLHLAGHVCKVDWRSNDERVAGQQLVCCHLAHFFQTDACARDTICTFSNCLSHFFGISGDRVVRDQNLRVSAWCLCLT